VVINIIFLHHGELSVDTWQSVFTIIIVESVKFLADIDLTFVTDIQHLLFQVLYCAANEVKIAKHSHNMNHRTCNTPHACSMCNLWPKNLSGENLL